VTGEARITREDSNVARVDINNDGKAEAILQIFTAAPNYRACDYPVYVELNESGTDIQPGNLNNLMQTPIQCPVSFAPFRYRGETYFEVRDWSPHIQVRVLSQVLMIKDEGLHEMCEFTY